MSRIVIDYFSLLEQPRRPWLDPGLLKEKFVTLSKQAHPDKVQNASAAQNERVQRRYAELNTAYQCLRAPQTRILHLLELETGARPQPVQEVPAEITEFFLRLTHVMREVDAFLRNWAASSGLLRARLFPQGQEWVEKLQALQGEINARTAQLETALAESDAAWQRTTGVLPSSACLPQDSAPTIPDQATRTQLVALYQLFSYYARWSGQIQERLTQLAL